MSAFYHECMLCQDKRYINNFVFKISLNLAKAPSKFPGVLSIPNEGWLFCGLYSVWRLLLVCSCLASVVDEKGARETEVLEGVTDVLHLLPQNSRRQLLSASLLLSFRYVQRNSAWNYLYLWELIYLLSLHRLGIQHRYYINKTKTGKGGEKRERKKRKIERETGREKREKDWKRCGAGRTLRTDDPGPSVLLWIKVSRKSCSSSSSVENFMEACTVFNLWRSCRFVLVGTTVTMFP